MFKLVVLCFFVCAAKGMLNGRQTDITQHPWIVSLEFLDIPFCTGVLISNEWVLTAALCIRRNDLHHIRAGSSIVGHGGEVANISDIIIYPTYDNIIYVKDNIALIKVETPFTTANATPAVLAEADEDVAEGIRVNVAGFGYLYRVQPTGVLREDNLRIDDETECIQKYGNNTEYMFCITAAGRGPCYGDEGSPVTYDGKVIGITSALHDKFECGHFYYPVIYTKVRTYRNWIREQTGI